MKVLTLYWFYKFIIFIWLLFLHRYFHLLFIPVSYFAMWYISSICACLLRFVRYVIEILSDAKIPPAIICRCILHEPSSKKNWYGEYRVSVDSPVIVSNKALSCLFPPGIPGLFNFPQFAYRPPTLTELQKRRNPPSKGDTITILDWSLYICYRKSDKFR